LPFWHARCLIHTFLHMVGGFWGRFYPSLQCPES
jgi:hypothetical protein